MTALATYGPDGCDSCYMGPVSLGHQMMHVTPESLHEPLPWQHPHLDLTITADARIDNRTELFAALAIPSDCQRAMPDSQLILYAYEKWGQDCPRHLLGDFAFAIWDGRTRSLFCARDPLGIKPFYYVLHGSQFVFASDMRGVLAGPGVPRRPNLSFIAAYLYYPTFMYHPAETFHKDVRKLPPAQTLTITQAGARQHVYLDWEQVPPLRLSSDAEYAEMLRDLLTQAVHCRMRSAHPVGAHLSGGLDSSVISVIAARYLREMGQQLAAFSWSPPPTEADRPLGEKDERRLVEAVANQEHIPVYYSEMTEDDVWSFLTHDISTRHLENTQREIAVRRMAAAQNIRVILSGWGGDQGALPTGKGYLSELFLRGRWFKLWRELHTWGKGNKRHMWRGFKTMVLKPMLPDYFYDHAVPDFMRPCWPGLLKPTVINRLCRIETLCPYNDRGRPGMRANHIHMLKHGQYVQRIEAWADRGAEQKIMYRYPLLDQRIVEFGLSVPAEQFFRSGQGRYMYFQATKNSLPDVIPRRKLPGDSATNSSDRSIRPLVNRSFVTKLIHKEVPRQKLYLLDESRLRQLLESFAQSELWLGFNFAIQCEYIWQYHAEHFQVFY